MVAGNLPFVSIFLLIASSVFSAAAILPRATKDGNRQVFAVDLIVVEEQYHGIVSTNARNDIQDSIDELEWHDGVLRDDCMHNALSNTRLLNGIIDCDELHPTVNGVYLQSFFDCQKQKWDEYC